MVFDASSHSARKATKPTHGRECLTRDGLFPHSTRPRAIVSMPTPSDPVPATPRVTELLRAWNAGDSQASEALAPLVYAELRRQAELALRRESSGHTLQTTALVHEAWLRLDGQHDASWESRKQFFAVAAQMMRRVLVDHARSRAAAKRGGAPARVTLEAVEAVRDGDSALDLVDLIALDDALQRLAALDPRKAQLVELRYFAGMSISATADALGMSQATVGREWAVARMWLRRELGG